MATYWENSCSFGLQYVSWYKYLIVSLVFSHLGFWSGNLFLIAPFPDLCLLVPLCVGPGRKSRRPVFSRRGSNGFYPLQTFGLSQSELPDILMIKKKKPTMITNTPKVRQNYTSKFILKTL